MFGCRWPSISQEQLKRFFILPLQVANSSNCHFCRAVHFALKQVISHCTCVVPGQVLLKLNSWISLFFCELLFLPLHSVACLCCPVFSLAVCFWLFSDSCQYAGALCGFMYLCGASTLNKEHTAT